MNFMQAETLSYAQSLRVIGQALEVLRISSFTLQKSGEKYVIRDWERSFLRSVSDKVWKRGDSKEMILIPGGRPRSLVYSSADTNRLEAHGRLRRGLNDAGNVHNVSLALRVVGDYLDRKQAVVFDISWSTESVTVKYQTYAHEPKEERFTLQQLHDLGVGMYLRRSTRRVARSF